MDNHDQGKKNREERRLHLQWPNPSGSPQVSSPPLTDSPKKPDFGLFLGIIGVGGMLVIFTLQSNGVIEVNWIISAVIYAVAIALIVASVLLHAIPHLGLRKRWLIGVVTLLLVTSIGVYGTFSEYKREHPAPQAAQAEPAVTVTGSILSPSPFPEGYSFAGMKWYSNDVDVRLDISNGAIDIQNVDFTIQMDTEIAGVGQITNFQGVTVFSGGPSILQATILDSKTKKLITTPFPQGIGIAPTYRVQCLNVLANTVVRFSIASVAVNPPVKGQNLLAPRRLPRLININGTYETRDGGGAITTHSLRYSTYFKLFSNEPL
jgi:hypothetical protein